MQRSRICRQMAANNMENKLLPQLPWVTRIKLLAVRLFNTVEDGTVVSGILNRLVDAKASAPANKIINSTTVATADIPIDPSRNLWIRRFVPKATADDYDGRLPVIIYFHGGGFKSFGADSKHYDHFCSHLAAKVPAVILSVNYRLAPKHRYPTQYDDGFEAIKFIDSSTTLDICPANTDFTNCFIAGDSAGANIAHHVTFRACKNSHEFQRLKFVGVIALQPFFGGEERTESELRLTNSLVINLKNTDRMWKNFLPEGSDRNHPAAHVWGDSDATVELKKMGFPEVFVVLGGFDPLQDWGRRYVEWLKNCGKAVELIEYPNAFHGFYAFPELPEFNLFQEDVNKFVKKQISSKCKSIHVEDEDD